MATPLDELAGFEILTAKIILLNTTERWGLESQAVYLSENN
jgi:hypothetical protein